MVNQFTRNGVLWAVPQLTDAGIALYFNADLLDAAGVELRELLSLRWSLDGDDTLRPLLARLTFDADGRTARHTGIRPDADPPVGLQRGQRSSGHLPQLHRVSRRGVLGRRPVRVRQPTDGRGVRHTWCG